MTRGDDYEPESDYALSKEDNLLVRIGTDLFQKHLPDDESFDEFIDDIENDPENASFYTFQLINAFLKYYFEDNILNTESVNEKSDGTIFFEILHILSSLSSTDNIMNFGDDEDYFQTADYFILKLMLEASRLLLDDEIALKIDSKKELLRFSNVQKPPALSNLQSNQLAELQEYHEAIHSIFVDYFENLANFNQTGNTVSDSYFQDTVIQYMTRIQPLNPDSRPKARYDQNWFFTKLIDDNVNSGYGALQRLYQDETRDFYKMTLINASIKRCLSSVFSVRSLTSDRLVRDLEHNIELGWGILERNQPEWGAYDWAIETEDKLGWYLLESRDFYSSCLIAYPLMISDFGELIKRIKEVESRLAMFGQFRKMSEPILNAARALEISYICSGDKLITDNNIGIGTEQYGSSTNCLHARAGFGGQPLGHFLKSANNVKENLDVWVEKLSEEGEGINKPKKYKSEYRKKRLEHTSFYHLLGIKTNISQGRGRPVEVMFEHQNKKLDQLILEIKTMTDRLDDCLNELDRLSTILKRPLSVIAILDHYLQYTRCVLSANRYEGIFTDLLAFDLLIEYWIKSLRKSSIPFFAEGLEKILEYQREEMGIYIENPEEPDYDRSDIVELQLEFQEIYLNYFESSLQVPPLSNFGLCHSSEWNLLHKRSLLDKFILNPN